MSNKQTYTDICTQHPELPVFLQHWWLNAVCTDWDVAIAMKGEQTAGVWPYPIEKKLGVSLQRTPLLTPYLGPYVFYPGDMKESNRDGFEHETITALMEQLPDTPVWNIALLPDVHQAGLFNSNGLSLQTRQTFLIDLQQDIATLQANMKENLRRNIRSAEKELTITNEPQYLQQLYNFQQDTFRNKDVMQAHNMQQLQQLMNTCLSNNAAALYVAKHGDNIEAIVWNVWDATTSYYLMGAQNPNATGSHAMSALLWHAMKESKQRGNTSFDLEGSMDAGVERFFRSFGGRRTLYLTLRKNTSLVWKVKELLRG